MKLLQTFKQYGYSNQIGPGVYDIHSPRVPGDKEIKDRLQAMREILPDSLLFVNPVRLFTVDIIVVVPYLDFIGLWTQDSWLERDRRFVLLFITSLAAIDVSLISLLSQSRQCGEVGS